MTDPKRRPSAAPDEARELFQDTLDRRGSSRFRSVCRIARVQRADDIGLWRVRNISEKGMMLATNTPLASGEPVAISLSEDTMINGRIVWADKGQCGVEFDEAIDVEAMLADLARQQSAESYRALRLPVDAEAILTTNVASYAIDLVNISQHGAGFRSTIQVNAGALVDILLPGDERRRSAFVRWARGRSGGLWFTRPLNAIDLESVARFLKGPPSRFF